eukprot:05880.XXX_338039_338314_1 [CDS] Oithona nana genome sequencing.
MSHEKSLSFDQICIVINRHFMIGLQKFLMPYFQFAIFSKHFYSFPYGFTIFFIFDLFLLLTHGSGHSIHSTQFLQCFEIFRSNNISYLSNF